MYTNYIWNADGSERYHTTMESYDAAIYNASWHKLHGRKVWIVDNSTGEIVHGV